jgi:RNA polymerase sigma-70 factor (ECF subfamily)
MAIPTELYDRGGQRRTLRDVVSTAPTPPQRRSTTLYPLARRKNARLGDALRAQCIRVETTGDRDRTFEVWLERYQASFLRFFRRRGCAAALAADLTQDTLMQIWRSRAGFRGELESTFRAWAFRIADTVWSKHWRRHLLPLHPLSEDLPGTTVDPMDCAAYEQARAVLRDGITELPPQMRTVVLLFSQDRTEKEIAVLLQVQVNTVKAHLHQARQKLARRLVGHA